MKQQDIVIFTIPGAAYRMAREAITSSEADFALRTAKVIKRGRGRQAIMATTEQVGRELADYFWSVFGVVSEMSAAERSGGREHISCQVAAGRIEAALRQVGY